MNGVPRKDEALRGFLVCRELKGRQMTADLLHELTGWDRSIARATLGNLKTAGLVEGTLAPDEGHQFFELTPKGEQRLAAIGPATAPRANPDLERQVYDLVIASPTGRDTESLAKELDSTPEQIEQLLALHVKQHRLVSCGVLRGGVAYRHFRVSAGASLKYHFGFAGLATAAPEQKHAPIQPPAPEPTLGQQIAKQEEKPKPVEAPHEVAAMAKSAAPAAPAEAPFQEFLCHVDSDGDTYIFSNGEEIELPIEHTRKLMRYFALIKADSIVIDVAGATA